MKKKLIVILFAIIIPSISILSQEAHHKWQRMSGIWEVKKSQAMETQGKAVDWNYYELLNLNSILSLKSYSDYNSLNFILNITERVETPAEIMLAFNVTSESRSWFYHLYAFKLTGGYWGIDRASFVFSDRADKTKPYTVKNNLLIKELAAADCKVKYGKDYRYRISFEGADVVLYINDEKILSSPFPEKSHDGRIAVSSKNAKIAIDKVEIKHGNRIIFEDDFNTDSIFVKVLKVQRVPVNNGNAPDEDKPE